MREFFNVRYALYLSAFTLLVFSCLVLSCLRWLAGWLAVEFNFSSRGWLCVYVCESEREGGEMMYHLPKLTT